SLVGEEAHIVSKEVNGPRYNDPLPMDQRDDYDNLLILCNCCHKTVDDQVNTFTVAVLQKMKRNHADELRARPEMKADAREPVSISDVEQLPGTRGMFLAESDAKEMIACDVASIGSIEEYDQFDSIRSRGPGIKF